MDLEAFKKTLGDETPPAGVGDALHALWLQGKGDWRGAHELAQAVGGSDGAWVHAHLHRVEGDQGNAGYWYRRAGKAPSELPLNQEWDEIVRALL